MGNAALLVILNLNWHIGIMCREWRLALARTMHQDLEGQAVEAKKDMGPAGFYSRDGHSSDHFYSTPPAGCAAREKLQLE